MAKKKPAPPATGPKWRTADGKEIYICQMESPHLLNALRLIERRVDDLRRAAAEDMVLLGENAPEDVSDAAARAALELDGMRDEEFLLAMPAYRALYLEARKRGLPLVPCHKWGVKGWAAALPRDPTRPAQRRKAHRKQSSLRKPFSKELEGVLRVTGFGQIDPRSLSAARTSRRLTLWDILYPKDTLTAGTPLELYDDEDDEEDGLLPWSS